MSPSTPRPSGTAPDTDPRRKIRLGVLVIAFLASVAATFSVDAASSGAECRHEVASATGNGAPARKGRRCSGRWASVAPTTTVGTDGIDTSAPAPADVPEPNTVDNSTPDPTASSIPTASSDPTVTTVPTKGMFAPLTTASPTSSSTPSSPTTASPASTSAPTSPTPSTSSAPTTAAPAAPTTAAPATGITSRYVDGSDAAASDANPGTAARPWRTLTKAGNAARPGERVVIRGGTYTEGLDINVSGTPGSRIVFEAETGHQVVLVSQCVEAIGQSHIEIRGLTVRNCSGGDDDSIGIRVEGPGVDDVVIDRNHVVNTYGSAISAWGVPWRDDPGDFRNVTNLVITRNLIEQANNGGYNEQITLANGVVDFEIAHNELRNSHNTVNGGEGIDVKEGSSRGTIHHNTIHDIGRRAIYLDGGGRSEYVGPVHDIDVYANIAYNVPNGFAIMSEGGADVYDVRVYNNLFYDIDDDCIFVYDHPNSAHDPSIGHFRNISFVNNTLANCGLDENWRMGIDINTDKATGVLIRNNIAWPRGIDPGSAETVDHNVTDNPRFVDGANRNFALRPGSPARDAGAVTGAPSHDIVGTPRPAGAGVDVGAYEG